MTGAEAQLRALHLIGVPVELTVVYGAGTRRYMITDHRRSPMIRRTAPEAIQALYDDVLTHPEDWR